MLHLGDAEFSAISLGKKPQNTDSFMDVFTSLSSQSKEVQICYLIALSVTALVIYGYATVAVSDGNYVEKSLFRLSCNCVLKALFLIWLSDIAITF